MHSRQLRHADALISQGQQEVSLEVQCVPFGPLHACTERAAVVQVLQWSTWLEEWRF